MKNLSPREISYYTSGILSFFILLTLLVANFTLKLALPWYVIALVPIISFAAAYFLVSFFIENFIYKKIQLIYKTIHNLAGPVDEKPLHMNMDDDIIGQVESEVIEWTDHKTKEIEDLKKMAQYRKEFVGNVTHELKTPIFNIQGYLHTLIDGGLEDVKVNKSYLYKAADNLERLNNIVEDLEVISLFENDSLILDITTFDIVEVIKEVIENLEMQADLKGIKIRLGESSDTKTMVKADRERVRQVIINLVSNSIRYGKENGRTVINVEDLDENIMVEVADNGLGIKEKHLNRLFERFYRVDKSRSRELGGTGLGLSIVKHIIEAHGQQVNVRSKLGEGSAFTFTLKKAK